MTLPEGWTDDMTIALPQGLTLERVVDLVLRGAAARAPYEATIADLMAAGLAEEDASLAYDRALGGLVRAATRNAANEPPKEKDPVAWSSYQRCLHEPELIAAIRPELAARGGGEPQGR